MEFDQFLREVSNKIGAKSAFDLARDARIKSLEELLKTKGVITQEEIDDQSGKELERLANDIKKMPPLPK